MTIGHDYVYSKWYNSAHVMTPLHGGAASGLKSMIHPHTWIHILLNYHYIQSIDLRSVLYSGLMNSTIAYSATIWAPFRVRL